MGFLKSVQVFSSSHHVTEVRALSTEIYMFDINLNLYLHATKINYLVEIKRLCSEILTKQ